MPTKDKAKAKIYRRRWYEKHTEQRKREVRARRAALRTWLREYKESLSCDSCLEDDSRALDFHHPGAKDITISKAVERGWSRERILNEIAKCIVLCSNCHRKLHAPIV